MWSRFIGCIVAGGLLWQGVLDVAFAQPQAKVYRIGWLSNSSKSSTGDPSIKDFQQGLRDLGYAEGKSFVIETRYASGSAERLPELAAELSRLPVDVIVTSGEPAALAAKRATRAIPVVATEIALDPVRAGLVASMGRPGGNVTGLATLSEELWQKRLALLKEVVPKLSRVAVLWNPANPSNPYCLEEIKAVAPTLGMQVRDLEVRDAKALEGAFAILAKDSPDALVTCWDSVTLAQASAIGDFAAKRRLPTVAPLKEYVEAGALLSFGMSLPAQRRRSAYYVDKILKGGKPADMPFETPSLFELVVNLRTAKALGVTVPPSFMVLADDLIR
jgi:putative tryptophan/tyrosine transport system substrate-binding protein